MSNIPTVQRIYEAFGQGDVATILDQVADDITWDQYPYGNTAQECDIPYMRPRSGHDGVVGFFRDVAEDFDTSVFNPHTFLEGNNHVAAVVDFDITIKATGKRIQDEEIHLWEFNADGKVTSFRHFLDTARAIEAHK